MAIYLYSHCIHSRTLFNIDIITIPCMYIMHATGLYIDHMNNSIAKKEKEKKSAEESYRTGVRTENQCMRIVLATHHATRALTTYFACMDLINLSVQYRYATITQHYRVQWVNVIINSPKHFNQTKFSYVRTKFSMFGHNDRTMCKGYIWLC